MARHRLSRDQVIWSFGPDLQPVLEIEPGDVVTFETNDCFTGQIRSEDDLVTGIDLGRINSATGPVAVRGAEPGDSLVAEILDVRPIEWGVATLIPGFGQLDHLVRGAADPAVRGARRDGEDERARVVPGEADGRRGRRRDRRARHSRPAKPDSTAGISTITGTARARGSSSRCASRAACSRSVTCTRRWATARSASRASRSQARSTSASTLLKGKQATWPVTELHDRWVPHATATDYAEALQLVSEEAAKLLVDEHGFTIEDAFIFLSVACDAGVAQACKPAEGFGTIARFSIPKIDACPGPFRV